MIIARLSLSRAVQASTTLAHENVRYCSERFARKIMIIIGYPYSDSNLWLRARSVTRILGYDT